VAICPRATSKSVSVKQLLEAVRRAAKILSSRPIHCPVSAPVEMVLQKLEDAAASALER
jgi:hypothetical protein